jgi:hypothetical protein
MTTVWMQLESGCDNAAYLSECRRTPDRTFSFEARQLPSFRDRCILLTSFMRGDKMQQRGKSSLPDVSFCDQKRRLLDEFAAAYREVMELQTQRSASDRRPDFSRFDDLIHQAKQKEEKAECAVVTHISTHHCW